MRAQSCAGETRPLQMGFQVHLRVTMSVLEHVDIQHLMQWVHLLMGPSAEHISAVFATIGCKRLLDHFYQVYGSCIAYQRVILK